MGDGLDVVEGEGGGGVAGDDEEFGALIEEEAGAGDGVAGDGLVRLGAVGETGGVAEVDVVGVGDEREESAEDGEAAEAGVEDADGGGWFSDGHGCAASSRGCVWVWWWCRWRGRTRARLGVAGEGVVGLAVDEEADLGDVWGSAAWRVPMMDWRVRSSTTMPEGWLSTKEPRRLTTAMRPLPGSVGLERRKTSSTAGPLWRGWAEPGRAYWASRWSRRTAGAEGGLLREGDLRAWWR